MYLHIQSGEILFVIEYNFKYDIFSDIVSMVCRNHLSCHKNALLWIVDYSSYWLASFWHDLQIVCPFVLLRGGVCRSQIIIPMS